MYGTNMPEFTSAMHKFLHVCRTNLEAEDWELPILDRWEAKSHRFEDNDSHESKDDNHTYSCSLLEL